ncbi:hypothetical protein HRI_000374300 [Hibiscus trionum]|uniref:RRM domain-containing protein n=1 Tax=Hibiscus trionum TaxID=183268 RepID=A0A9W7GWV8_HIBTR|nr:hypothetical protein HRI_000374300 [Hibiscus trionum]
MTGRGRQHQTFTLFIENLSEKLHWQGLWFAFGRYGDVVDAFIARKRNGRGRRFGFVRFGNKFEAVRAIKRLNGFVLFGSKIRVSMARFKPRQSYWRRVRSSSTDNRGGGGFQGANGGLEGSGEQAKPKANSKITLEADGKEKGECSSKNSKKCKKITGVVETEEL